MPWIRAPTLSIHANPTESLTDEERERIREYYRTLNFKEFLAACPIEDIDHEPGHSQSRKSHNPVNPDSDNHRPAGPGASGGLAATAISPARNTATAKNVNGIR